MPVRTHLSSTLVLLLVLAGCSGRSLPVDVPPAGEGLPEPENLAWWSRAAMDTYMRFSSWRGERSGYIALFARDGVPVHAATAGWKDIDSGTPMSLDTQVRIASMTKPVVAVAAMILVEEGRLNLDDPVAKYLPEFAGVQVDGVIVVGEFDGRGGLEDGDGALGGGDLGEAGGKGEAVVGSEF